MLVEQAFRSELVGTAAIAALVGARVHFVRAPQDVKAPYIVVEKVDQPVVIALSGKRYVEARFQVNAYAPKYGDAKAILEAVRVAMDEFSGLMASTLTVVECRYDDETDLPFDEDLKLHGVAADYILMYSLAIANS